MNCYAPFYTDTFYHVYNHAVGIENLFRESENFRYFLKKYFDYIQPVCDAFAYCLMPNHFHFLLRVRREKDLKEHFQVLKPNDAIPGEDWDTHAFVSQQFSNFCSGYAKAINKRYKRRGALFCDYIKRLVVMDSAHLLNVVRYIHWNPVYHGFCKSIETWNYSSYNPIISGEATLLSKSELFEWYGGLDAFISDQRFVPPIDDIKDIELNELHKIFKVSFID